MGACRVGIHEGLHHLRNWHLLKERVTKRHYPYDNDNIAISTKYLQKNSTAIRSRKKILMHASWCILCFSKKKKSLCKLVTSTIWSLWERGWQTEIWRHGFTAALIQGCPKPVIESCNQARFCVLQGKQQFLLGFRLLWWKLLAARYDRKPGWIAAENWGW